MKARIVFVGANHAIAEALAQNETFECIALIADCRVNGAGQIKSIAQQIEVPYFEAHTQKDIFNCLQKLTPIDLVISASANMFSSETLSISHHGFINVHFAYLPFYKGANPIYHMLLHDEKEGGVSLHRLDPSIDGGPIADRQKVFIEDKDDIVSILKKCEGLAVTMLIKQIPRILAGESAWIKNEPGFYCPPIQARQWIDLKKPARWNFNLVRSQTLYGGCFYKAGNKTHTVIQCEMTERTLKLRSDHGELFTFAIEEAMCKT